jgi:hypothetical protein
MGILAMDEAISSLYQVECERMNLFCIGITAIINIKAADRSAE